MSNLTPQRGLLLVRPVDTDETLPGSHIILTANTRDAIAAHQCEVLAVGEPAECDPTRSRAERRCERTHHMWVTADGEYRSHGAMVDVGDWILIRPRSALDSPHPEQKQWFVHQDAVLAIFQLQENDV